MSYLIALLSLLFITGTSQPDPNVISITAEGQVEMTADIIQFNINLNAEAESPQKAYDLHKKREKVLVDLLKEHKIDEKNINFEPITINKAYHNQHPRDQEKVVQTRQQVALTLDNFDIYEKIQIALIDNGFDEFSGNFTSSQSKQGEDEALREALKLARTKAEIIAKESGLTITGIKTINYSYSRRPPQPVMEMSARKSSDSLMEFDQTVSVSAHVSVTYKFE